MVAIWILLAVGVAVTVVIIYRLVTELPRMRAIEAEGDAEMAAIEALDTDEAFARAQVVLREQATLEEWTEPIPPPIDALLAAIDPRVAALLRRYRKVSFPEDHGEQTVLSAELLDEPDLLDGQWTIGVDEGPGQNRDDWQLCIKPGAEAVSEVIALRSRQTYKSLWHYILLAEDEV